MLKLVSQALACRKAQVHARLVWKPARPRRRLIAAAAATAALLAAGVWAAPAHATYAAIHKPSTAKTTLYQRLGGKKAITAVVDDFIANVAADTRINRFFAKTDIPRLKRLLVAQLCQGTGGPCRYSGRSMKASHRGLGISGADFGALVEDLQKSLDKFKVPAREQKELIAILAPMKKDIVER